MCDDIEATTADFVARGAGVDGPPVDQGWGVVVTSGCRAARRWVCTSRAIRWPSGRPIETGRGSTPTKCARDASRRRSAVVGVRAGNGRGAPVIVGAARPTRREAKHRRASAADPARPADQAAPAPRTGRSAAVARSAQPPGGRRGRPVAAGGADPDRRPQVGGQ